MLHAKTHTNWKMRHHFGSSVIARLQGLREAKSKRVDGTTDDPPVLYGDVPPPILIGGEY